jgi:hypothetical protein
LTYHFMPRAPDPYLRAVTRGTMSAEPPCPPALLISDSVWYEVCFRRPRQLADLVASDIPCARQSVGYALDQTVKRSSVAALVARPTCFLCAQQAILSGRNLIDGSARLVKVEAAPVVGHTLALAGLAGCDDGTSSCGLIRETTYDDEHQN